MKISVGIAKLDELLEGGIEQNTSILLLTDTMVDKASFAQQIVSHRTIEGDVVIYITTSKPPSQVLQNMYEHGWESKGMVFVDCISYTRKQKSPSKYTLKTKITEVVPAWDETMEILEKAVEETKGFKLAVFDCLETFMGIGAEKIAKKVNDLKKIFESTKTTCVYLLTDWGYKKNEIEAIRGAMDTVINLGTIEKKLLWMNYFQYKDSPKVFFQITLTGVNLYVPKILVTGPWHAGKSSIIHALSEKAVSVDRLGTTVALDHGYIEKKGMVCDIFGTPGQERFDWILAILSKDIWGAILVVDSTKPESYPRAIEMLEKIKGYDIPFLVFANKQDLPNALKPEEIKKKLGLPEVVGTSAITKEGCEEGLKLLFDKIFKLI